MQKKYFFLAFIAAFLFATSTPASKLLLQDLGPIFLASLFYLGASMFLIPFSYSKIPDEVRGLKSNPKDILRLMGGSIFGGIIGPIFLLFGIRAMDATSASLLLNFETAATTFLAWVLFKEHISKRILISSVITVIAGILLTIETDLTLNWGGVLIIVACLSWGMDNHFTARVEGVSPQTNTIIKGTVAGIFNLSLAYAVGEVNLNLISIASALIVGGLAYGLSITLYIAAARHMGAARSQIVFASNPFLGCLISYFVFFDNLDIKFFIALFIMVLAVVILFYEKHHHMHIHSKTTHNHEHSHDDGHHMHTHPDIQGNRRHTHQHKHDELTHSHPHYPDIHHNHEH